MNEPGNNFFSRPAFSKEKNWNINVCYQRRLRTDLPHGGAGGYEEYVITKLFHFANIVLLIDAKALIDYRVEFGFLERLGQIVMCSQPYSLYYLAGIADAGEHDYLYPRPELPQLLECLQPINAGHQQV